MGTFIYQSIDWERSCPTWARSGRRRCACSPSAATRPRASGDNRAQIIALRDDYESLFERVLERGGRTGEFQITDLRVARLALIEMCNGVALWYRPDGRLSIAELQDRFVELACRLAGSRIVRREECGPEIATVLLDSEPRRRCAGTA